MENVNKDSLHNLYKNVHMALESISYVMKEADDVKMKEELAHQYEGYEAYAGKLAKEMLSRGEEPKEPNVFKKAMLWGSIKMNTLTDGSKSHIADMLIQGTTMGLTEVMTLLSESGKIMDETIRHLAEELRDMESSFLERLKSYL
ncbi:MAG: hypothetical protein IIY09_02505 [Clostridia bacterium]|nr:hypothetical protein [Clostridia bacterium]MBQ5801997.1 hypothetical protein [Clostridia bacterium]